MTDWTSAKYVVVDVEGNGQHPPDLVELAAVPIVDGNIGQARSWLVRPDQPIAPFARRIHGITNEAVADAPVFSAIAAEVLDVLADAVLVAHNAHVDVGVLQRKLNDWQCPEVFDTLKLTRRLRPELPTYKLGELVQAYYLADDLPPGLKPHRATYDALVTARLFVKLVTQTYPESLSLEDLRGQPPEADHDQAATLF